MKQKNKKMTKKYEFLPHTADAEFKAYGKSLEEAFTNAGLATYDIITDIKKVKPRIKRSIVIHSRTKEALLYDYIEELLFLTDTEAFLVSKISNLSIKKQKDGFMLEATISGDIAKKHEINTQIKAVTYNDMFIKEEKGRIVIQVVVDI